MVSADREESRTRNTFEQKIDAVRVLKCKNNHFPFVVLVRSKQNTSHRNNTHIPHPAVYLLYIKKELSNATYLTVVTVPCIFIMEQILIFGLNFEQVNISKDKKMPLFIIS